MLGEAVSRLRIRGPRGIAAAGRMHVEDALRLAPRPSERVLVIRHLELGRHSLSAGSGVLAEVAGRQLRLMAGRAVHGASPGSGAAEAVWFASGAEARAVLLSRLLAGERPAEWFWRLVVPDLAGLGLRDLLPRVFAIPDVSSPGAQTLVQIVCTVAARGRLGDLLAAMTQAVLPLPLAIDTTIGNLSATPSTHRHVTIPDDEILGELTAILSPATIVLGTVECQLVRAIAAEGTDPSVRSWLAVILMLSLSPSYASRPSQLASIVAALCAPAGRRWLAGRLEPVTPRMQQPSPPSRAEQSYTLNHTGACVPMDDGEAVFERGQPDAALKSADVLPSMSQEEVYSRAAGLLLVVTPLKRLGLGQWTARRPEPGGVAFPWALLDHIAVRHRVDEKDAIWRFLEGPSLATPLEPWLELWRKGLDRWLRRTACRRLTDIVHRGGWLHRGPERITVRYPLVAADLRLRRRALDADPGWTPWLGTTIVYRFSDGGDR